MFDRTAIFAFLFLLDFIHGASIPPHASLSSFRSSSSAPSDRILVGTHWITSHQEHSLSPGASKLIYEVQIPVIAFPLSNTEPSPPPKAKVKRWNNEYFNRIEASDPQSRDSTQYDQWNYILPGCFMLCAMLGNAIFMVAGLALCVICWKIARCIAIFRRRRRGAVEKGDFGGESVESVVDTLELESRRCVVLSEREMQALRNWEEGLPSWAMD
jgi:hypothetical protein